MSEQKQVPPPPADEDYIRCADAEAWGWFGAALTLIVVVIMVVLTLTRRADAHGDAQWIADGAYQAANGTRCCGVSDCHRAPDAKVEKLVNGYKVTASINGQVFSMFVAKQAVFGSIDAATWFCALPQDYLDGRARCLFLPGSV